MEIDLNNYIEDHSYELDFEINLEGLEIDATTEETDNS